MLKFARRNRWLLPLTLLLTVVILQVCMPAGGSQRGEQRSSRSKVDELEYEGVDYETEGPLEEMVETDQGETVTARSRKPFRRYYTQKNFVLLPLIVVAIAAVYAAAGYVLQSSRVVSDGRWFPRFRKDGDKSTGWFSWLRGKRKSGDRSDDTLQFFIRNGKRVIAPAAALALAVGVTSMLYNQQMLGDGGASFFNSTLFGGGPLSGTNPLNTGPSR